MKCIETFAGCGGLSLGLKSAGFDILFSNELSPIACETYSNNLLNSEVNVIDLNKNTEIVDGNIYCGDFKQLVDLFSNNNSLIERYKDVDLISGGPPCQGFSSAGLRKHGVEKNDLPHHFINFVSVLKPKVVLIENVIGILMPFKVENQSIDSSLEIIKSLIDLDYCAVRIVLNAAQFGVAENRRRVFFFAIRKDIFDIVNENDEFYNSFSTKGSLKMLVYDFEKMKLPSYLDKYKSQKIYSVKEAIDDLSSANTSSSYVEILNAVFSSLKENVTEISNHEERFHKERTKIRFKLKQYISGTKWDKLVNDYLVKGFFSSEIIDPKNLLKYLKDFGDFHTIEDLRKFLNNYLSKKHSQRVLSSGEPSHTIVTIPDDLIHYNKDLNRVLTVRECARIQSFPDRFVFYGKVTTGGHNREFEAPQYTQVGNAVPPLVGLFWGNFIKDLLSRTL